MHYKTPMKRRILSMFLSFVCLFSLLPTSVFAASATDTVPDVITLNHCEYNQAISYYKSEQLDDCYLHIFNYNVNGEVMTAFCADHPKLLGNALVGKRWNNPTLVEDEYINIFLNYYHAIEAEAGDDTDALWSLNSITNPWMQACVWLREEGCFNGKTQDEIIELCAKERQAIIEKWDTKGIWTGTTWDSTTNSAGNTVWSSKQAAEAVFRKPLTCSVYHYDYAETTNVTTTTSSGATKVYTPENTQGIYILNTNMPVQEGAKIKVKKVDADTGTALAGAEFEIRESSTGALRKTLTTGADGTATSDVLQIGTTYTVTETKAPNGYTIDDSTKSQTVTLTEDTTVTLTFKDKASGEPPLVYFDWNIPGATATYYWDPSGDGHVDIGQVIKTPRVDDQTFGGLTFHFEGWYTEPTGGERIAGADEDFTVKPGKNVYYAQWTYTEAPGGDGGGGTTPAANGLYNVTWDYGYAGSRVTSTLHGKCVNTFVYYVKTVTVITDSDGNTSSSTTYTEKTNTIEVSIAWSQPENPTRPGYTFKGWALTPNATSATYPASGNGSTPYVTDPGKAETFYAVWKADSVTVKWDANGGKFTSGTTKTVNQSFDESLKVCTEKPTKEGYTFSGWYLDTNCTYPLTGDWTLYADVTFYAGWSAEPVYVLYYDTREGTGYIGNQEYRYGDTFNLFKEMTDTSGWQFTGWSLSATANAPAAAVGTLTKTATGGKLVKHAAGEVFNGLTSDRDYWTLDLYATWSQNTTQYTVSVDYDDYLNNDGCRPVSLDLGVTSSVYNNNVVARETMTVDASANAEKYVFKQTFPITTSDASTEKIIYRTVLLGYTDVQGNHYTVNETTETSGELLLAKMASTQSYANRGYATYEYTINNAPGADVTTAQYHSNIHLDHAYILTGDDVRFNIEWRDDSNNDGSRPGSVLVILYGDRKDGSGYVEYARELVSPDQCTVSADGNTWTYIFKDRMRYYKGNEISYVMAMRNNDGVTTFDNSDYTSNPAQLYTAKYKTTPKLTTDPNGIILTKLNELADKRVTVKWNDESNRDGVRPDEITVSLYAYQWNRYTASWEHRLVGTKVVDGDGDTWYTQFDDCKVYNDGVAIVYYAQVTSDLNAQVTTNPYSTTSNELDIEISRKKDTKSVVATIEWDDDYNNDGIRPDSVYLQLGEVIDGELKLLSGKDYSVVLSGDKYAQNWVYTFENLPVYTSGSTGKEATYVILVNEVEKDSIYGYYVSTANGQEEVRIRYAATYVDSDGKDTKDSNKSVLPYIKLSHGKDTGTSYLYIDWDDANNIDGMRPASQLVTLKKTTDGKTFERVGEYLLTATDRWTYKLANLPVYEDGKLITYVAEFTAEAPEGYTLVGTEATKVHLRHTPKSGSVSASVNWSDNNDNDGRRPDAVTVELYANGAPTGKVQELNAQNNWTVTWSDIYVNCIKDGVAGTPVDYSVVVTTPDGYTETYTPATTTATSNETISILLSKVGETVSQTATIVWQDNSNHDSSRPASVNVQLYADGEKVAGKTLDITGEGDTWTGVFTNLPKYKDGKEIYYSIGANDNIVNTYKALPAGMTMYLSRDIKTADLRVDVKFNDGKDADGQRPETFYIYLTVNGERVNDADSILVADNSESSYEFVNLPVYKNGVSGEKLVYGVEAEFDEDYGSTSYTSKVSQNNSVTLGVNKTSTLTLTLSRDVDVATQTGHIYWFDNNNQRGNRPTSLVINLMNDATSNIRVYTVNSVSGEVTDNTGAVVGTVTVSEWGNDGSSCWTYTIDDLPYNAVYESGSNHIFYYTNAQTVGIATYYTTVTDGKSNGMNIGLTHKNYLDDVGASQQDFTVKVLWQDNANAWGYRPNTLGASMTLYANGNAYKTVKLSSANADAANANQWTYTFEDLPTYLNGAAVVWTAGIEDVDKYTVSAVSTSEETVLTMMQSIGFSFTARWDDSNNDDAVRPTDLTVDVYGDGTKLASVKLTESASNVYTASVKDLPVWRSSGDKAVEYSFSWGDATALVLSDNAYRASATKDAAAVSSGTFYYLSASAWGKNTTAAGYDELSGMYEWETTLKRDKEKTTVYASVIFDDDANRDGLRPASVTLQLYADDKASGSPVTVTGGSTASSWNTQWVDMDVYSGGKQITYTVKVTTTPSKYSVEYDESGLNATLKHEIEKRDVVGSVYWDDRSEAHYEYNSLGTLINSYYRIERVNVYAQLYANGEPLGEPRLVSASGYGEGSSILTTANITWPEMPVYENEGNAIVYTMKIYSNDLTELLENGYTMDYDYGTNFAPKANIQHTYFDISGDVYYLYNTSDDFLLPGVTVTAYLYNEAKDTYTAVGSAVADENGHYILHNLPQGLLSVRATYTHDGYTSAGSVGVNLFKCDAVADIVVSRDAQTDGDLYRYSAEGYAFYQTDKSNAATITPVPAGSIALLYKVVSGSDTGEYLTMVRVGENGKYTFPQLANGQYYVNVAFTYDGGTYTYDNDDAVADGLRFLVSGADAQWPNIIKQVNAVVEPGEPIEVPGIDEPSDEKPIPCVVSGKVFFSDSGVHSSDPVSGVDVYLYSASNNALIAKTSTDDDGAWSMENIAAGAYIAVFAYSGSASRVLNITVSDADYTVGAYTAATQYFDRTQSTSTSVISGVVLDEDGNQISALVKLFDASDNLVDFMYADGNGRYEFTVAAGHTYRVVINEIEQKVDKKTVGDPDGLFTTLDYYTISGVYEIESSKQANATVALYTLDADGNEDTLVTATLTDTNGAYLFRVANAGNYRVILYRDGTRYATYNVSVGYQEYEPVVNGSSVTGSEPDGFTAAKLYNTTTSVETVEATLGAGTNYSFTGLTSGTYRLELTTTSGTKTYYIDVPADAHCDVNYYITVSGRVVDKDGKVIIGSKVRLLDKDGKQVGSTQTIHADGLFGWSNLNSGTYQVEVTYPVSGDELVDRTTVQTDSFGRAYANGITAGESWVWNVNASSVRGTVKDQYGTAIKDAVVVISLVSDPDKAYVTSTDENGAWSAGVAPGSYTVTASYAFDGNHKYIASTAKSVTVETNTVDGVDFIITRHTLSGKVVRNGDNSIVSGATVTVRYADNAVVAVATADENGAYSFVLYPDNYTVTAEQEGASAQQSVALDADKSVTLTLALKSYITGFVYRADGSAASDATVYYSGVISGSVTTANDGSYTIPVSASEYGSYSLYASANGVTSDTVNIGVYTDVRKDITLPAPPVSTYALSGVVTDNEGNRLADAAVILTYGNDKTKQLSTSTDDNGNYLFYVPSGTYYLTASYKQNGYVYQTNAETMAVVNDADASKNIAVKLTYDVTIKVVDANGTAISGASIAYTGAATGTVATGSDGTASFSVAGGTISFVATIGNRTSNTQSIEIARNTSITLTVPVTGLSSEEPDVDSTNYTISGVVTAPDGSAVSGITVKLFRFNDTTEEWDEGGTTVSDADGKYTFTDLAAGSYRVEYVYDVVDNSVPATSGSYVISGYAVDSDNNPYMYATVILLNALGAEEHRVTAGADGYYEFTDLRDEHYTVRIIPAGVTEPVGETPAVPAPGNFVIEGTVKDANGDIVVGANIVVSDGVNNYTGISDEDGFYSIVVPNEGNYSVTITYPVKETVKTSDHDNDANNPIQPKLNADDFTISGYVHDTDGNVVSGATVTVLNASGTSVASTTTDTNGYYEITGLAPGDYTLVIKRTNPEAEMRYDITANPDGTVDVEPDSSLLPASVFRIRGTVVADHHRRLAGAVVTFVKGTDTYTVTTDSNGAYDSGNLPVGRYTVNAVYADSVHGDSVSEDYNLTGADGDTLTQELVIVLKYVADVNGDGTAETVYAGEDDLFDTADDFFYKTIDGVSTPIYAGADKTFGTADDHYDTTDPDNDGKNEPIYAGEDKVFGTDDDTYIDNDGNTAFVKDVYIRFNANGGKVNSKDVLSQHKSEVKSLPTPSRDNYTFDGWYTDKTNGTKISMTDINALTATTEFYAHWTAKTPAGGSGTSGGSTGGGGSSGGSGGGGGGSIGGGGSAGGVGGGGTTVVTPEPEKDAVLELTPSLKSKRVAYLHGYDDGLVHPGDNITRAQTAMILYRLLTDDTRAKYETSDCAYTDVSVNAWYRTAVATLSNMGIIKGVGENRFAPDAPITRAEFVAMISRFTEKTYSGEKDLLSDVSTSWAREYINLAVSLGWVAGMPDGTFRPNATISRAEAATILNRVLLRSAYDSIPTAVTFPDNADTTAWYYGAIQEAANGDK